MFIDKMKPGSELDALVAEQVMGWRWEPSKYYEWPWVVQDGVRALRTPSYSTDITAAWEVVEKMVNHRCDGATQFEFYGEISKRDRTVEYTAVIHGMSSTSSTAPHAICLAALRAKEEEMDTRKCATPPL